MDPTPFGDVPAAHVEKFGSTIERYWQWMDDIVGEVLAQYDEPPLVLVVSDHGFGPAVGAYAPVNNPHLSGAHRYEGILIAHGPGVRAGGPVQKATILDVTPTLLYYMGLPVGRDMDGRVLTDLFDSAFKRDRPIRELASYESGDIDVTKAQVVESAADPDILEHLRSLGYIQ